MTATAEKLEARIEDLPEGSFRRQVLEGARRFKSSWVELGKLLSEVKRKKQWEEWGFASFDQYVAKELFIRRQTAEKLTMSYGFLERHEPELVGPRPPPRPVPSFEVIEVLSRAEESGRLDKSSYRELRDEIFDRSPTPAQLNRKLAEKLGPAERPHRDPQDRVRRLADAARRLAEGCKATEEVPRAIAERAAALAEDLEGLL